MRSTSEIVRSGFDDAAAEVRATLRALREADAQAEKAVARAATARDAAARRRLEAGKALIAARRLCKHGEWLPFLKREGIEERTARNYMDLAGYVEGKSETVSDSPSYAEVRAARRGLLDEASEDEQPDPPDRDADSVEIISHGSVPAAPDRGAWCTPRAIAAAVGGWDLDPFSNPRSAIIATTHCMLEYDDDGLPDGPPGSYRTSAKGPAIAGPDTRVWIQPPYSIVLEAIAHYGHTRFCALLRLDPSTEWFERLWEKTALILVPKGDRLEFIPPPGVEASSNPFPHCLFYARAEDATEAIRALCYEWRVR